MTTVTVVQLASDERRRESWTGMIPVASTEDGVRLYPKSKSAGRYFFTILIVLLLFLSDIDDVELRCLDGRLASFITLPVNGIMEDVTQLLNEDVCSMNISRSEKMLIWNYRLQIRPHKYAGKLESQISRHRT